MSVQELAPRVKAATVEANIAKLLDDNPKRLRASISNDQLDRLGSDGRIWCSPHANFKPGQPGSFHLDPEDEGDWESPSALYFARDPSATGDVGITIYDSDRP